MRIKACEYAPKLRLRGFKPNARGAGQVLGDLETAVMELVWRTPVLTVNQVEERLQRRRQIAHTTVLTTLDRMHRKCYLTRKSQGKAFVYSPRYTREQFERGLVQEVLGGIGEPVLSTFIELIGEDDGKLDRLEALIKEKREGRKR